MPGKGKKDIHLLAPKPEKMAEALLDIHSLVRPRLAVMDAIVAMEGNGPAAGRPRGVGLVIAGADAVSLDAVAAEIIGFDRGEVDTTRLGHERGLGIGRIEEIQRVRRAAERGGRAGLQEAAAESPQPGCSS